MRKTLVVEVEVEQTELNENDEALAAAWKDYLADLPDVHNVRVRVRRGGPRLPREPNHVAREALRRLNELTAEREEYERF